MKYTIENEKITAEVSEAIYYTTNSEGEGLFRVSSYKGDRKQLLGTAQFSVRGLKDASKKAKMRAIVKEYEAIYR